MATRLRFTHAVGGALDDAPGWVRSVLAAAEAALGSAMLVVLPVFVVWLASPNSSIGGAQAMQLALAGWCLAHGGEVAVGIGVVSLTPLLLTLAALSTAAWWAQRLASGLVRDPRTRLGWAGGLRGDVAVEGGVFVLTYTLLGTLAALAARSGDFTASVPRSAIGFAVVGAVAYLWGLRIEFRADLGTVAPGWRVRDRVVDWARAGVGAGLRTLAGLVVVGLVLVFLLLIVRFDRVAGLYDELTPGVLGGIVLTGLQSVYLPNFAIWALSWMAGPGFGVGAGSTITLTQATPGLLPLVPFLGALPEPGPLPLALRVAFLIPVLAGVFLERRVRQLMGPDILDRALAAAAGCATAALGASVLGVAAGGALGSARLAHVGAAPFLFAALLGGELVLGAALSLGVGLARSGVRRPAGQRSGKGAGVGAGAGGSLPTSVG